MPSFAALLAAQQQQTPASDPWTEVWGQFAGYGIVGVVAFILGVAVWRLWIKDQKDAQAALDREVARTAQETARADRAEQAFNDLNREMRDKVVPILTEVVRVTGDLVAMNRNRDR